MTENVKRYYQLNQIIKQSKERHFYQQLINQGLDHAAGIILSMPIKDEKILQDLNTFSETVDALEELYGVVQQGPDAEMYRLHDNTVAESIKLINDLKNYAFKQEKNAEVALFRANKLSPKGAARMNVATNSQVLHALTQLIRINGQILKMQSEDFASQNKRGKDSAGHFYRVNREMENLSIKQAIERRLPQF